MSPRYDLLKEAYAIIGGIPDYVIELDNLVTKMGPSLECGTICCAAGWLAQHPKFKAMGLRLVHAEGGTTLTYNDREFFMSAYGESMARVFRIPYEDACALFASRDCSRFDEPSANAYLTDKQLWLARVRKYLAEKGQLGGQGPQQAGLAHAQGEVVNSHQHRKAMRRARRLVHRQPKACGFFDCQGCAACAHVSGVKDGLNG